MMMNTHIAVLLLRWLRGEQLDNADWQELKEWVERKGEA